MTAPGTKSCAHDFRPRDFIGGHPVLDFVNTVTGRGVSTVDWLLDYQALVRWAHLAGVVDDPAAAAAQKTGAGAQAAELNRCKELREALFGLLTAIIEDRRPEVADATILLSSWRLAAGMAELDFSRQPAAARQPVGSSPLTTIRRRIAADAVTLLTHLQPERLRRCDGEVCGWLFLDTSKAGRRRWCDMATCGNAAKSRRRHSPHPNGRSSQRPGPNARSPLRRPGR